MISRGLSVRETEALAKRLLAQRTGPGGGTAATLRTTFTRGQPRRGSVSPWERKSRIIRRGQGRPNRSRFRFGSRLNRIYEFHDLTALRLGPPRGCRRPLGRGINRRLCLSGTSRSAADRSMSIRASAARYARALLDVTITESDRRRGEGSRRLRGSGAASPGFQRTLANPVVSATHEARGRAADPGSQPSSASGRQALAASRIARPD